MTAPFIRLGVPTHYISDYGHFSACGRNVRFTSNHPEKVDCLLCRKTEGFKEAIAMVVKEMKKLPVRKSEGEQYHQTASHPEGD